MNKPFKPRKRENKKNNGGTRFDLLQEMLHGKKEPKDYNIKGRQLKEKKIPLIVRNFLKLANSGRLGPDGLVEIRLLLAELNGLEKKRAGIRLRRIIRRISLNGRNPEWQKRLKEKNNR